MPLKYLKHLEDILLAVERIEQFTAARTFAEYAADELLRSAVERQFLIIGEAIIRLRRDQPAVLGEITSVRPLVAFRNILVHAYELVDDAKVWHIIEEHLPILRRDVEVLLEPWRDWPPEEE
jgi:uncharacterized protein with HEPN domain